MLHFFLCIPCQQHCLLFDPVPLSPVNFSDWGKLKQGSVMYNQGWNNLAPNPVPVLCLEQQFNAVRKRSKHSPLKSHKSCLLFDFGNSSLKIFYIETALGKGKVKESDWQEIFLQNHGCKWLTATATVSEKNRSWDISSLEANPSTIAHKRYIDKQRPSATVLVWSSRFFFCKPKVLLNLTESM